MPENEDESEPMSFSARALYDGMTNDQIQECSRTLSSLGPEQSRHSIHLAVAGGATDKFFDRLFDFVDSETLKWLTPLVQEMKSIPWSQLKYQPRLFDGNKEILGFYETISGNSKEISMTEFLEGFGINEKSAATNKKKVRKKGQ